MRKKKTHEQFLIDLEKKNKHYRNGEFEVLGKYKRNLDRVLVENIFGKCLVTPNTLLNGFNPSIKTSVNKTEYFISQAKEVHGNKYDYSEVEYINCKVKIPIKCKKGHKFIPTPSHHLTGTGCPKCAYLLKGSWTDKEWGDKGKASKHFDSFKVYIIRCRNKDEEFYKIGKTFKSLKTRFPDINTMPYSYEIVKVIESKTQYKRISKLERELQKQNNKFKYLPSINFKGYTECFSKINLE